MEITSTKEDKNIKVGRRRTGAGTLVRQPSRASCIDFKAALVSRDLGILSKIGVGANAKLPRTALQILRQAACKRQRPRANKMYALQKYQYLQLIKNHQNATEHHIYNPNESVRNAKEQAVCMLKIQHGGHIDSRRTNIMIHYMDKSTASTRYIGVTHGLYQTTTYRPLDGR